MNDQNDNTVFVYGTLRRDEIYSSYLNHGEFLDYDIIPGYILRDLGEYPMAFERNDTGLSIKVEVYKIDSETLHQLDILEECRDGDEESLYKRKTVFSSKGYSGFLYYGEKESDYLSYKLIPGGDWNQR